MNQTITSRYQEAMEFINNLARYDIKLGLDRVQALLSKLGHPEQALKVIHIGGTNGKGSTAAVLASVLRCAGYSIGMFTSPHPHDYRERITLDGEKISEQDIIKGITKIRPQLRSLQAEGVEHPTEFEVSTALALWYFAEKQPDFVLLEVGMGGAVDSTNVVDKPLLSVITSIGIDHMNYLGRTIGQITVAKAGIIKKGIPVITSASQPEALNVIKERAQQNGSRLIQVGKEVQWIQIGDKSDQNVQVFNYYGTKHTYMNLGLALYGQHQLLNASTALAAVEMLEEKYNYAISEEAVRQGLLQVKWPGRQELLLKRPKILLDAAHNADGARSLAQGLETGLEDGRYQRDKLILCMGILGDKETAKIVGHLVPLAELIIVTRPNSPRAKNWELPATEAEKYVSKQKICLIQDPIEAIKYCLQKLKADDMLCVTGSIYLLSEVRTYLLHNWENIIKI